MSFMMRKMLARLQEEETGGEGSTGGVVTSNSDPVVEPAGSSTEESVNWGGMSEEFEASDEGEVLDVEGDLEVVEPASKPAAPVPAPATVAPAPVEPVQAAPVTPQPATPVAAPAPTAEATPEAYQAWRTTRVGELTQMYALSEEDTTAMLTDPETVLPKLAAQVHMEVLENSMRAMQAMMPVMMQQLQQGTERNNSARNLFTSVNPDLADPQFEPAIMQLGQVFRQVNPSAGPEEASRAIGNLVRSALGIAQPAQGGAPAAPRVQAPAPAPFMPARGSGSGGGAPAPSGNEFERLAMEFLQDE
jgi:hypothetical protein